MRGGVGQGRAEQGAILIQCLVKGKSQFLRWLSGGHISLQTRIVFRETHQWVEKNPYANFRQNSFTGYGEENPRWPTVLIFVEES